MVHGIQNVAAVAGMFIFAIIFFGVMTDAGMLDPLVDWILRTVGSSPPRIVMGTRAAGVAGSPGWLGRGDVPGDDSDHAAASTSGSAWTAVFWPVRLRWRRA